MKLLAFRIYGRRSLDFALCHQWQRWICLGYPGSRRMVGHWCLFLPSFAGMWLALLNLLDRRRHLRQLGKLLIAFGLYFRDGKAAHCAYCGHLLSLQLGHLLLLRKNDYAAAVVQWASPGCMFHAWRKLWVFRIRSFQDRPIICQILLDNTGIISFVLVISFGELRVTSMRQSLLILISGLLSALILQII